MNDLTSLTTAAILVSANVPENRVSIQFPWPNEADRSHSEFELDALKKCLDHEVSELVGFNGSRMTFESDTLSFKISSPSKPIYRIWISEEQFEKFLSDTLSRKPNESGWTSLVSIKVEDDGKLLSHDWHWMFNGVLIYPGTIEQDYLFARTREEIFQDFKHANYSGRYHYVAMPYLITDSALAFMGEHLKRRAEYLEGNRDIPR